MGEIYGDDEMVPIDGDDDYFMDESEMYGSDDMEAAG